MKEEKEKQGLKNNPENRLPLHQSKAFMLSKYQLHVTHEKCDTNYYFGMSADIFIMHAAASFP